MNVLPIVHRELRIGSRKRATYISRAVVAGVVVLLWLFISVANSGRLSTPELAQTLFWTYGILALLYALLSGVFFTADSLSAERRDGTLGLLFLTDLKGFDVVFGKLAATSWHGVYSLLVIVPVMALPLLMGGVSFAEMLRMVTLILSSLFFSLALGLLVSTLCRRLSTVVAATFLVLLSQCSLPWLIAMLMDELFRWGAERNWVIVLSPFTSLAGVTDLGYRSGMGGSVWMNGAELFWMPVVLSTTLGVACLGTGCWLLPRLWRREQQPRLAPAGTGAGAPPSPDGQPAASRPTGSVAQARLEANPYGWLALRGQVAHRGLRFALVGLVLLWAFFAAFSFDEQTEDFGFTVAIFGAFAIHVVVKGWLALESSRRFCEDRQSGALELLLTTPVRTRDIVLGEWAAIKRTFRLPMALATAVSLALITAILVFDPVEMHKDRWWFSEIVLWGGVILWLDARALVYTGMLRGLRTSRHHRAVLGTLARVVLIPWAGVVLFFLVIILPGSGFGEHEFIFCMRGWFVLGAMLDLVLLHVAKLAMEEDLRALAAENVS